MDSDTASNSTSQRAPHTSQEDKLRDKVLSPPAFVEIKDMKTVKEVATPSSSLSSSLPPSPLLAELDSDESSSYGRRLRSYRTLRRVWHAFLMWVLLLVISLSRGKVHQPDSMMGLDMHMMQNMLFNSTLFPDIEHHLSRINHSIRMSTALKPISPGVLLAQDGAHVKHPVVMIPGFVTSGLELWEGTDCAKKYFRQRLWGALGTQMRGFFTETECWRQHLALDPITGMDPDGIRIRAAQGFEAADYFMTTYWVWNKLIENLAAVGYDGSTMSLEAYDWRLSFPLLEKRDGYFTKLMHKMEAMHKTTGQKVVIAAHSMGSPLMTYFLAWVTTPEKDGGGGGGKDWADKHIHAFINIAGPLLGVPKAVPSILSGEMKDTNVLMGTFGSMLEQFFGRRRRKDLWASWGSLWAMLPKGGVELWGPGADMCSEGMLPQGLNCVPSAEADPSSTAPFLSFTDQKDVSLGVNTKASSVSNCTAAEEALSFNRVISKYSEKANWSVDETLGFLEEWGNGLGSDHAGVKYHSLDRNHPKLDWSDPTSTPLPDAPAMKIYCLYGVGLDTERSFFYKQNDEHTTEMNKTEQCSAPPRDLPFVMDGSVMNQEENITYGVRTVDGDASVPLLSLGYMCVDGWKKEHLNPSGIRVVTREYVHQHEFSVEDPMRSGPKSADHVDILGNLDMTQDFLRIVTDFESSKVEKRIISDIENIAARINAHPLGGLKAPVSSTFSSMLSIFSRRHKILPL